MKSRKEIQKELLAMIDAEISERGEDAIALMLPNRGKDHWTYKEVREAIVNDNYLDGLDNSNPIDGAIRYYKWKEEQKNKAKINS